MDVKIENGDIFNEKWRVEDTLGNGSYGITFEVEHVYSGLTCAMKVTRKTDAANEIDSLIQLGGSEYFPKLYEHFEVGCAKHHKGIVMSLGDMDLDWLRIYNDIGTFETRTTLALSHHLVNAVEFMHSKKIVHRDIKLSNVVMKQRPSFKNQPIMIIDFGIAISIAHPREPNRNDSFFKMSRYSSPRMHNGLVASPRCDMTMLLYSIMKARGINNFEAGGGKTCIEKRIDFEANPHDYIPTAETWIIEMAQAIFAVPYDVSPNYKRIQEIISGGLYGFQPKEKLFHFSTVDGNKCMF